MANEQTQRTGRESEMEKENMIVARNLARIGKAALLVGGAAAFGSAIGNYEHPDYLTSLDIGLGVGAGVFAVGSLVIAHYMLKRDRRQ